MMTNEQHGLGRVVQFDERSRAFQVRELLEAAGTLTPRSYTWKPGPVLDQDGVGACVGFGWAAELAARPVVVTETSADGFALYHEAQALDGWPVPHEGSSVLAGAKAVQARGHLSEYRWAGAGSGKALEDLVLAVGHHGPAVLGTNWYEGMDRPDPATGRVSLTGAIRGGHCWLVYGVSPRLRLFHGRNSWGESWGVQGSFAISWDGMERLLHDQGEACVPVVRL